MKRNRNYRPKLRLFSQAIALTHFSIYFPKLNTFATSLLFRSNFLRYTIGKSISVSQIQSCFKVFSLYPISFLFAALLLRFCRRCFLLISMHSNTKIFLLLKKLWAFLRTIQVCETKVLTTKFD